MQLHLMTCVFKRTKDSNEESGVLVNEGQLIIDASGNLVEAPIWNYTTKEFYFSVTLNMSK